MIKRNKMINSKGKCSFDENQRKHIKWFDKWRNEVKEKEDSAPKAEPSTKTFYQKVVNDYEFKEGIELDSLTWDDWAYEKHLITYEDLQKRKNAK